jgi:hypothetical protein
MSEIPPRQLVWLLTAADRSPGSRPSSSTVRNRSLPQRRRGLSRPMVALSVVVLGWISLLTGCTTVPADTARDTVESDPAWAEARSGEESGETGLTGLSERSRQIERNLGLR